LIVVDASAVIEVLLRTPKAATIEKRLFQPGETWHAPHLIDVEVAQVLRRLALAGTISPKRGAEALQDFADMPIRRHAHDWLLARAWELRDNLTAYDAAYVALAEALEAPLLTCDGRIARAAGVRVRVEVV
jgi:predicted nucleic acid-binding protein